MGNIAVINSYVYLGMFLFQYKNDLKNDEEIFVEKTKLIEECKSRIRELEDERAKLASELDKYLETDKQRERQIFEQQLKLQKLNLQEQQIKSDEKSKIINLMISGNVLAI